MTMRTHGSMLPLFLGSQPESLESFGFAPSLAEAAEAPLAASRNLFGPATDSEIYRGHGRGPGQQAATRRMMQELAMHMKRCAWPDSGGAGDDNPAIPAGYTYLAQLAAHDLVSNTAPLPRLGELPGYFARDYRAERLVLDTIYGGGPAATLLPFAINVAPRRQRHSFRLGHVPAVEPPPAGPRPSPMTDQPARDIARAACPFLTDRPGVGVPDALLADPRNDDHLILSQLTALFCELHNIVYSRLAAAQGGDPSRFDDFRTYRTFLEAHKIVALLYRRVIVDDLLRRLLEPGTYVRYAAPEMRWPDDFLDRTDDGRVPVEFSHAAYRFGHVMVRFSYILNDRRLNGNKPESASIKEVLDRSSSRRPDLMPLAGDWLVDWSRFFDLGDGKDVNPSRRITPFVASGLLANNSYFPNEDGADGGLFYRDLIRGAEAGMRTVGSLIDKLRPEDRQRSQLLSNPSYREHAIGKWLTGCPQHRFAPDDLVSLTQDPPLFFFILFEAMHCENGERLGILGSTIMAEIFFAAYKRTRSVIEEDATIEAGVDVIFGGDVPRDMPSLIRFITRNGGLKPVSST